MLNTTQPPKAQSVSRSGGSRPSAATARAAATTVRRFVNDEILHLAKRLDDTAATFGFLCECGHLSCRAVVEMTLAQYQSAKPGSVIGHGGRP